MSNEIIIISEISPSFNLASWVNTQNNLFISIKFLKWSWDYISITQLLCLPTAYSSKRRTCLPGQVYSQSKSQHRERQKITQVHSQTFVKFRIATKVNLHVVVLQEEAAEQGRHRFSEKMQTPHIKSRTSQL